MINVNNLKNGQTIQLDGNLFVVIEFQHVKPGKGAAFVRSKLKNLRTGATIEHTFNAGISVPTAHIDKVTMTYLYDEGETLAFMDMETFDQISVPKAGVKDEMLFLKENMEVEVTQFNGEILGITLPIKVALVIAETEPNIKGDTKSGGSKTATLETGASIMVPLFIEQGEEVIVNTETKEYVSRA